MTGYNKIPVFLLIGVITLTSGCLKTTLSSSAHEAVSRSPSGVTPHPVTYIVQAADLADNGYDEGQVPRQSVFSRFVFMTNATEIEVSGNSTLNAADAYKHLGLQVDGVARPPLVFSSPGDQAFQVTLGASKVMRRVELIVGAQSTDGGAASLGTFIKSVSYGSDCDFVKEASTVAGRVVIYGDSISVGTGAPNPEYESYAALLRSTYLFNTMVEGWGWRALYDDAVSGAKRSNLVSRLVSYHPAVLYLAIGTNDYGLNKWDAASFGGAYAAVVDAFHSASPSTKIVCQTPVVRSNEGGNAYGNTTGDFRNQIAAICGSRSFTVLVNGPGMLTLSDMSDGLHPSVAGNSKYADAVATTLHNLGL